MKNLCLYFQAHQPYRIRELSFFEMGDRPELFDKALNKKILTRVTGKSYKPSLEMFGRLIKATKGKFRCAISATGILLEQFKAHQPEIISDIKKLLVTHHFELLGETYYHSFASLYSLKEFEEQVKAHKDLLKSLFRFEPVVFRNTELAFRSDIMKPLEKLGFKSIFIEGSERTLRGNNPNYLYSPSSPKEMTIFTRNQEFSNIFTCKESTLNKKIKFPDTKKVIETLLQEEGDLINIWFDIECLGEHLKESTGIFEYFEKFIDSVIQSKKLQFILPSEAASKFRPKGTIDVYSPVTWHIKSNDISAWNGNAMQIEAMKYIYGLERKLKATGDSGIIESWRKLQSSDHFLYMDTEESNGNRPAQQFSPFKSPHEAYIYLMNALASLEIEAGN